MASRQENIGAYYEELTRYMPPQEAIALIVETLDAMQGSSPSILHTKSTSHSEISTEKSAH